jgi:HEAT repeat protein
MRKLMWIKNGSILTMIGFVLALPSFVNKAEAAAIDQNELQSALKTVRTYKFGQSRLDLTKIEGYVRDSYGQPAVRQKLEAEFVEILKSPAATSDGKRWVCRQLSLIGTAASTQTLGQLLLDKELSDMARYALERIDAPEATAQLRLGLAKTSGTMKVGIINSLGQRRDSLSKPEMIKLLGSSDQEVAMAAARALGNIGGADAAQALEQAQAKTTGQLQQTIVDAYLSCAELALDAGRKAEALAIYQKLYTSSESRRVRVAALGGLVAADSPNSENLVVQAVKSKDNVMQAAALSLVRDMKSATLTGELTRALGQLNAMGQVALIGALADRGDKAAQPSVVKSADSTDAAVRVAALEALAKLGDASTVPLLARKATSVDSEEKNAARQTLNTIPGVGVNANMIALLDTSSAAVQSVLLSSLAARGASEAVPTMLQKAKVSDSTIRKAAMQALGDLAEEKDMPKLVDLLLTCDAKDLADAEKMAMNVIRRMQDLNAGTKAVLAGLDKTKDTNVISALLRLVGRMGTDLGLMAVQAALKEADTLDTAIRVLSDWPTDKPADDLRKVAQTSSDLRQSILATRGYISLIGKNTKRPTKQTLQMYADAMQLAKRVDEKRLVLAGIANLKSVDALNMVAKYLDEPALQQEAASAAVKIAESFKGKNKTQVKPVMEKVLQVARSKSVKDKAQKLNDE